MLRASPKKIGLNASGFRFAIVASRYNERFSDALLAAAQDTLAKSGAEPHDIRVVRVPGSFEITAAAAKLAASLKFDVVIALGVIMQGETEHAHFIAQSVAHGLTTISIQTGVPTVFGIVTVKNKQQAAARCLGKSSRGVEAAQTAIEMAHLFRELRP
jgi:6,7-dimethyl-8-ribityllumazine synthase